MRAKSFFKEKKYGSFITQTGNMNIENMYRVF